MKAGPAGLAGTATSAGLTILVAMLGPSAMEPSLPGGPGQPPYSLVTHPAAGVAVALAGAALVAGVFGLAMSMYAAGRGWVPSPRTLLIAGLAAAAALTFLPPFGSADHLSYAGYGRMLTTGHDPYATGPSVLGHDPVGRAVEDWRTTPSVYGPLATAGQALASLIGGTSVRLTVFADSLLNLAAFAAAGLLLHLLARSRGGREARAGQARAALLWTANPLLLYELMAGGHVDTQAAVFALAAVATLPATSLNGSTRWRTLWRCAAAGALTGLGAAVKLTAALPGGGLAWAARRSWQRLTALATGFLAAAGVALAVGGPHVMRQAARGERFVSIGSPWRAVRSALTAAFGAGTARSLVSVGSLTLALALLVLLARGLPGAPRRQVPGGRKPRAGGLAGAGGEGLAGAGGDELAGAGGEGLAGDEPAGAGTWSLRGAADATARPGTSATARAALAFTLAWLFAWPYVLPWYDALAWVLLPLLAWSWLDWLVLARTAALAVGYLPARGAAAGMPAGLGWLQSVVRAGVTPAILAVLAVVMIVACARGRPRMAAGVHPMPPARSAELS